MANVRIFNLTKALANRTAIPHPQGNRKLDAVDFEVMNNIMNDAVVFNFYERLVRAHREGEDLTKCSVLEFAYAHEDYNEKKMRAQEGW
eukprot:CAMPEP_0170510152 /NCGR_PEP_ID=MMETSP0208-20121228/65613_1 /TAXON_ID=197538 /ORGANISM="Strombidium inclinatum, Strain S3" /LENGTH=88 /DNA_ID=CAMNT_0010793589 /DNA_START=678 /DNA_END=941 /DNA_ORIENTATION=+